MKKVGGIEMKRTEFIKRKYFLRTTLVRIKLDIEKKHGDGVLSYKKTLSRVYDLCEQYGISKFDGRMPYQWDDWLRFCSAYEEFIQHLKNRR